MIHKLLQIGDADDGVLILVQWPRQRDEVDWTWQPCRALYDDVSYKSSIIFTDLQAYVVCEQGPYQPRHLSLI